MYNSFATPWTVAHQAPLVHGICQARILEWVANSFSRGSSQPRDWTHVSCIGRQILYHSATREARSETHIIIFGAKKNTHTHTHAHPVLSKVCIISFVIIITPIQCCSAPLHSSSLFVTLSTADEIRMVLTECFSSPWKAGIRIVVAYSPGQQRH